MFKLAKDIPALILAGLVASASAQAASEGVVYSFKGGSRGHGPIAPLIQVGSKLYGTTRNTVFSLSLAGKEEVLHVFTGGSDGADPQNGGLAKLGNMLYGTTFYGGQVNGCSLGCGTVYELSPQGDYAVLYRFVSNGDGIEPFAGLTALGGILYGTTGYGPGSGAGTVFFITPQGAERVLYSFGQGHNGGYIPYSGLTTLGGVFYGTTGYGGSGNSLGTIYTIDKSGKQKTVYSFQGGTDGSYPESNLIEVGGILYGVTPTGGTGNCNVGKTNNGCGTVFSVTPQGTERVLHSFQSGTDGAVPVGALLSLDGVLYGTTLMGGGTACGGGGCDTVFSISPQGQYSIVYDFQGGLDGSQPGAALINVNGVLYGTTESGGGAGCSHHLGCGTVFEVAP